MDLQALKNKYDIIGNDPALNDALETAVKVLRASSISTVPAGKDRFLP